MKIRDKSFKLFEIAKGVSYNARGSVDNQWEWLFGDGAREELRDEKSQGQWPKRNKNNVIINQIYTVITLYFDKEMKYEIDVRKNGFDYHQPR